MVPEHLMQIEQQIKNRVLTSTSVLHNLPDYVLIPKSERLVNSIDPDETNPLIFLSRWDSS